jgi:hypothetical protein
MAAAAAAAAAASPCCAATPILASCFGYAPDGPNSASLQAAVSSCGNASFTIDVAPGSDGVWFLEGLPPHAAGAGPWRDAGSAGVTLNASGQTVTLAPGVSLRAAPGFYAGAHDVLVAIRGEGISLLGTSGSLLAMQRLDYANARLYNHSEWRHAIAIDDSRGVALRRLRIEDTGGDGVDIAGTTADVSLVDVVTDRAFRNGVSVTGVDGLLIANSSFLNSAGTPPMAGIDLEPASPKMRVNNVTVRNVTFAGNQQIQVSLSLYEQINVTDNVLFENVTISDGPMTALMLFSFKTNGPLGSMVFRDIVIKNVGGAGILFERNGSAGAAVEFTNVVLRDTATEWYSSYGHWPLDISGGGVVLAALILLVLLVAALVVVLLLVAVAGCCRSPAATAAAAAAALEGHEALLCHLGQAKPAALEDGNGRPGPTGSAELLPQLCGQLVPHHFLGLVLEKELDLVE